METGRWNRKQSQKTGSDRRKKIIIAILVAILLILVATAYRAARVADSVSVSGEGFFSSIMRTLPVGEKELRGISDGRINVALLGMRGQNIAGGGLLADTIMVASIKPEEKKVSLVSIPRDLYVTIPDENAQEKINAVHFYGEERGEGKGLAAMKEVLSAVSGQQIHYAVSINFEGFRKAIDDIGGVSVTLEEPFIEPLQYHQEQVCDPEVFTVPSGNEEVKTDDEGKETARYPLCYNANEECGGIFELPAGTQTLDGENALCYARARMTSSDFDRARRQQEILTATQDKLLSAGTLTDFTKVTRLLDTLEDNVRTDMAVWEMQKFFELYQNLGAVDPASKVLDSSEEGLLYVPQGAGEDGAGFILLPRGDNYDRIHELFGTII